MEMIWVQLICCVLEAKRRIEELEEKLMEVNKRRRFSLNVERGLHFLLHLDLRLKKKSPC